MKVVDLEVIDGNHKRIGKLRRYYEYFEVEKRYGIDFVRFLEMVDRGTWKDLVE